MEKATNFSFSIATRYGDMLDAGMAFFYNKINDRITYVRDAVGGDGMYQNFGEVTRKGADLTVNWKPRAWLNVKSSYEYLAAKDENTGLTLACSPEHRAQLEIQYKPMPAFTTTAIYEYTSKQFTRSDNAEHADPYDTIELKADYSFERWRIFGRIKNLTDRSYLYAEGLPAPPRTWLVGMSMDF
jgi:iron complex outermembrane receptor protein